MRWLAIEPDAMARDISSKYFWSLLKIFQSMSVDGFLFNNRKFLAIWQFWAHWRCKRIWTRWRTVEGSISILLSRCKGRPRFSIFELPHHTSGSVTIDIGPVITSTSNNLIRPPLIFDSILEYNIKRIGLHFCCSAIVYLEPALTWH